MKQQIYTAVLWESPMPDSLELMELLALDPEVVDLWTAARRAGCAPGDPLTLSLDQARLAAERHHAFLSGGVDMDQGRPAIEVRDIVAPTDAGALRVRLFRPSAEPGRPALVYFHGGGFVVNSVDTHDHTLRWLALRSGATVCAVDYDKAPEHRFPHQHDQAVAAVRWVVEAAGDLGIDPARIAVGGDSAGANLALAAALAGRGGGGAPIACALLLYGMFAPLFDTPSHRRFGDGRYGLSTERMRWYWSRYLGGEGRPDDPRAAPLLADLHGAPPMILVGAGFDCLLDDTVMLAERLAAAGVDHQLTIALRLPHSFAVMAPRVRAADAVMAAVARDLGQRLGVGGI